MARPATASAPTPAGARADVAGVALRALRSGRLPAKPRMLAAAGGLALTALAFAAGALGSSTPADAGAYFRGSAAPTAAVTPAPTGAPVAAVVAPSAPPSVAPTVAPTPVPSAAPSVPAAAASTAPAASAQAFLAASTTSNGAGTAGNGGGSSSADISLLGSGAGALDPLDLISKGAIVVALLYVTLRVLRRMQGGTSRGTGRIQVLESRPLAAKASLHLVEVGDRCLVVGLTPAGMVSLAELGAEDLPEPDPAAQPAAGRTASSPGVPALAGLEGVLRGGSSFAASLEGALGAVRSGLGGARSRIGPAR